MHHDRGDSTTVAAAAAWDEDGGTRDRRLEPVDGHSGLSAIYDMAEDEELYRYVVAGEDDGDDGSSSVMSGTYVIEGGGATSN
jgi:hypothetical protein